jgi:hypothetical protein
MKRSTALLLLAAALSAGCAAVQVRSGDAYQRESASADRERARAWRRLLRR